VAHALPARANLRFLKTRAKSILKQHRSGTPEACEVLRHLSRFARSSDELILSSAVTLLDVQYALSLYYGFHSWNQLKQQIERSEETMARDNQIDLGNVHIVTLEHLYAMSFYAFDKEPELKALAKLRDWAEPKGLLANREEHPIYGFNNPSPYGNKVYGYEFWIRVDNTYQPEGDMRLVEFSGGLYAVTNCPDLDKVGMYWAALTQWPQKNGHRMGTHQWLEKIVGENPHGPVLDLHLPIV
jgi:hypothetical protein